MSEAKRGKPGPKRSQEAKDKYRATMEQRGHPFKGKTHSEETKDKIRKKLSGLKLSDEQKKIRSDNLKKLWELRKLRFSATA